MVKVNIKFDQVSEKHMNNLIKEMIRFTGAEAKKVVRNVGRDFTKIVTSKTPQSRKKRTIRFFRHRDSSGNFKEPASWYKRRKRGIRITLKGRGYAKAGWIKAFRGLNITKKAGIERLAKKQSGSAAKFSHFVDGLNKKKPFVEIGNKIPYIAKLDSERFILGAAMAKVQFTMLKTINNFAAKMEKKWQ